MTWDGLRDNFLGVMYLDIKTNYDVTLPRT
jgi:hypothetical protein